jgi:hypothetical protein
LYVLHLTLLRQGTGTLFKMSTSSTVMHSVIYLQRNNLSRAAFYLVTDARSFIYFFGHHHKHQGLGHLARSVSRVTAALTSVSSFSFTYILYGSENWTLTASQRQRIEVAEMKLLRPLAGRTFNPLAY